MIVGITVILIVVTAGMVSTTWVQFLKGSLLVIFSAILTIMLFLLSGCMGGMAVSGMVSKFNLEVTDNKWGREAVFLGLYIIPVYEIAALVDLIVVNSIEFHTGTNPLSGKSAVVDKDMGTEMIKID